MKNENVIAIDGPAGSGKSSVAKEVALRTDFNYFDSGSYYRAVTLFFYNKYKKENSKALFSNWVTSFDLNSLLNEIQLSSILDKNSGNKTLLNGKDVSEEIRHPEITEEIKHLASNQSIRSFVNNSLYELSKNYKLIIDGRDIGTEVFPNAIVKIFLTASPEERAMRRKLEQEEKGIPSNYESILSDIIRRDDSDRNRKIAPLKMASDAFLIDTSGLSKNVVISMILSKL
ncbi:MAG: (d)CMP kinase [Leptospiraceae bacterium]|nr:(d)CMP kinase [Leptospiraceae bacterium]